MTTWDRSPDQPVDRSKGPPLTCTACGEQMDHLGVLPAIGLFEPERVYRCPHCSAVRIQKC
jgi:DNA-directed RNA polymerase subunit RPC12/RpoP